MYHLFFSTTKVHTQWPRHRTAECIVPGPTQTPGRQAPAVTSQTVADKLNTARLKSTGKARTRIFFLPPLVPCCSKHIQTKYHFNLH